MLSYLFFGILSLVYLYFAFLFYKHNKILDKPKLYGFNRKAVPYSFGFSFVLLFIVLSLFFTAISTKLIALLFSVFLLGVTCFIDDRRGLSPLTRLIIQTICSCVVVFSGVLVLEVSNPFADSNFNLGSFSILVSVFWLVLLTNLMNFLDGVSGLASGVSSVGFLTLFLLSLNTQIHVLDQSLLSALSLIAFLLSLVGFFLELPLPNPKVLLGDSGSMFFGFLLASLSMINGGKLATLGIVLLIPLLDGFVVIFYRILKGGSPLLSDTNHLHHKLLERGFSRLQIIGLYMFLTLLFGVLSIFAWNTFLKFVTLVCVSVALLIFFYLTWNFNGSKSRN